MAQHNILGKKGEKIAAQFLISQGFVILNSGWRSGKSEIDLIVENNDFIVFVEVKTRRNDVFGGGLSALSQKKQNMILAGADDYVMMHSIDKAIRFDLITIDMSDITNIKHYKEAFGPEF